MSFQYSSIVYTLGLAGARSVPYFNTHSCHVSTQHATKHTNSASLPVVLVSSRHLLHFYDGSCCAPPHQQRLPAAGPPPGESGEVRGCDFDSAVSGRAKNPLPIHRSALEQREEEEEAEEREKEGEGQTAEAGEEEVEGGVSSPPSPHRAALPYPATAT